MPVIVLLPLWAFLYHDSVTEPEVQDPALTIGAETFAALRQLPRRRAARAAPAPQLNDGEVLEDVPRPGGHDAVDPPRR